MNMKGTLMPTKLLNNAIDSLSLTAPIIQAPMAGGATTPELIAGVSNAGGLGSLGAAFLDAESLDKTLAEIKKLTNKPFLVNLFVPERHELDSRKLAVMKAKLAPCCNQLGIYLPELDEPFYQDFEAQLEVLLYHKVPVVSFIFGAPDTALLKPFKDPGVVLVGTATSIEEAKYLEDRGMDAVVAQGYEAGGHRGTFLRPIEESLMGTLALTRQISLSVAIPIIAAGGIMDGKGIKAALTLGATAVQMGTAFLSCPEAGVPECYKRELMKQCRDKTRLTKVITGRYARGIYNEFIDMLSDVSDNILDFPIQSALTKPIRKAAAVAEKPQFMSLWAGQGASQSRGMPVTDLVAQLMRELDEA